MRKMTIVLTALAMTLTACGAVTTDTTEPATTDPKAPLLQMTSEGGFAPLEWILRRGPIYTLLADGTLIYEGPVIEIYPGPLLPNYQAVTITQGEVDQIVDLVKRMGLDEMVDEVDDSAANNVADATTEVFTYWDPSGASHRYSVYALGIGLGNEPEPTKLAGQLRETLDRLASSNEAVPYEAEKVRVLAGPGVPNADFEDIRPWPLEDAPGDPAWQDTPNQDWACKAFGPEVLEKFTDASELTVWVNPAGSGELRLLVRPLLPGETDCPTEQVFGA